MSSQTATEKARQASIDDYGFETTKVSDKASRYVFYAFDLIPESIKQTNPAWSRGGLLRPGVRTLMHCNGYIPQCQIREMRPHMESVNAEFVAPHKREYMESVYEVSVKGKKEVRGVLDRDPMTGTPLRDPIHDGLLRIPIYPVTEIATLTSQVDGLVEMPVNNDAERDVAQRFLFENWEEFELGILRLPNTFAQVRAYLQGRLDAAEGAFQKSIALAALRSCDQFKIWGGIHINEANKNFKAAEKKGYAWGYGDTALVLFDALGIPRQDIVAQGQADQMSQLTGALKTLVELQSVKNTSAAMEQSPNSSFGDLSPEEVAAIMEIRRQAANLGVETPVKETTVEVAPGEPIKVAGRVGVLVQRYAGSAPKSCKIRFDDNGEEMTVKEDQIERA